jgi:molybdopterin molybdotransferase
MNLGVETLFYKVHQKPGKPLFAGRVGSTLVFALPGNPASALVCFYEYVYPVIRRMKGHEKIRLPVTRLPLLKGVNRVESRAEFIRAQVRPGGVVPLAGQDSAMLHSFALADALIYLPSGAYPANEGDLVEVHLLPSHT